MGADLTGLTADLRAWPRWQGLAFAGSDVDASWPDGERKLGVPVALNVRPRVATADFSSPVIVVVEVGTAREVPRRLRRGEVVLLPGTRLAVTSRGTLDGTPVVLVREHPVSGSSAPALMTRAVRLIGQDRHAPPTADAGARDRYAVDFSSVTGTPTSPTIRRALAAWPAGGLQAASSRNPGARPMTADTDPSFRHGARATVRFAAGSGQEVDGIVLGLWPVEDGDGDALVVDLAVGSSAVRWALRRFDGLAWSSPSAALGTAPAAGVEVGAWRVDVDAGVLGPPVDEVVAAYRPGTRR